MTAQSRQVLTELLVLSAQAGRVQALAALVAIWQAPLLRHARRLTACDDAAADVMQESWLEIHRCLGRLEDPARFAPWAYRIVTYRSAHWVRKRQRRRQAEQTIKESWAQAPGSEETQRVDSVDAVRGALRRLSADQQAILELRYVEEFSTEQIAEALGIAVGTVKSRLFHARQKLREYLS